MVISRFRSPVSVEQKQCWLTRWLMILAGQPWHLFAGNKNAKFKATIHKIIPETHKSRKPGTKRNIIKQRTSIVSCQISFSPTTLEEHKKQHSIFKPTGPVMHFRSEAPETTTVRRHGNPRSLRLLTLLARGENTRLRVESPKPTTLTRMAMTRRCMTVASEPIEV